MEPILLYAAAFWLTDAVRDSGRGGMAGEAAEVVEGVGVAAEEVAAGVAAVAPGRSHGFGGEAMASNADGGSAEMKSSLYRATRRQQNVGRARMGLQ